MKSKNPNLIGRLLPHDAQSWQIIGIVLGLLSVVVLLLSRHVPPTARPDIETLEVAPAVGFLAPDFTLQSTTGETVTLSELRGQPVVVNFWATWCGPCRIEMPYFQAVSEIYAGQVHVIGVNQREAGATVEAFAAGFPLTYPLLLDPDNAINQTYAVFGLPTTVFIDEYGVIQSIVPGTLSQAVLEERIGDLNPGGS